MSTTASPVAQQPEKPGFARWQGVLGVLGRRPLPAALIMLLSLSLVAAAGYFVLYPQLIGGYHLRQARRAAQDYRLEEAREHLDACLQVWPASGEAHFLMGRTCRRMRDLTAARHHLQEANRCNWDKDDIDLEFRLINLRSGLVRLNDQSLLSLIGTGYRDEVYVLEAVVEGYFDANFLDDAHRLVQFWIQEYPQMWRPQLLRGFILERGLKPNLAMEQYSRLLGMKPDQPEARLQLAHILLRGKQLADARDHFQIYLKYRPNDPHARTGLARCARELREPEAALPLLEELLRDHPNHAEALLLRGKILLVDMGQTAEALPWLQRADKLRPDDLETIGHLAQALRILGRPLEAVVYENRSQVLEQNLRKMEGLIRDIIATDQTKHERPEAKRQNVQLRYEAGMTLLTAGQIHDGRAWLHSALQEDPGHAPSLKAMEESFAKDRKKGESATKPDTATPPKSR